MSKIEELKFHRKERVADFRKSGQSMSKWCKENTLKVHQLQIFRTRKPTPLGVG
ncbi:IS66 family insertion sequence element accessory protein TnpA [Anaerobacillus alkalidiazotrophicus]|uniref:IS66 family insertion sequence element accessory protein TnpA n=1 Tax=Anaerobacillus alkalidiazotrophicus TaxID=472963 RepID=UPI001471CC98|nr:hypothetical protein [Anaerobacillus alkalidiazotrophicus]